MGATIYLLHLPGVYEYKNFEAATVVTLSWTGRVGCLLIGQAHLMGRCSVGWHVTCLEWTRNACYFSSYVQYSWDTVCKMQRIWFERDSASYRPVLHCYKQVLQHLRHILNKHRHMHSY